MVYENECKSLVFMYIFMYIVYFSFIYAYIRRRKGGYVFSLYVFIFWYGIRVLLYIGILRRVYVKLW